MFTEDEVNSLLSSKLGRKAEPKLTGRLEIAKLSYIFSAYVKNLKKMRPELLFEKDDISLLLIPKGDFLNKSLKNIDKSSGAFNDDMLFFSTKRKLRMGHLSKEATEHYFGEFDSSLAQDIRWKERTARDLFSWNLPVLDLLIKNLQFDETSFKIIQALDMSKVIEKQSKKRLKEVQSFTRDEQEGIVAAAYLWRINWPGISTLNKEKLLGFMRDGATTTEDFRKHFPYINGIIFKCKATLPLDKSGRTLYEEIYRFTLAAQGKASDWQRMSEAKDPVLRRFFFAFEKSKAMLAVGALDEDEGIRKAVELKLKEMA